MLNFLWAAGVVKQSCIFQNTTNKLLRSISHILFCIFALNPNTYMYTQRWRSEDFINGSMFPGAEFFADSENKAIFFCKQLIYSLSILLHELRACYGKHSSLFFSRFLLFISLQVYFFTCKPLLNKWAYRDGIRNFMFYHFNTNHWTRRRFYSLRFANRPTHRTGKWSAATFWVLKIRMQAAALFPQNMVIQTYNWVGNLFSLCFFVFGCRLVEWPR